MRFLILIAFAATIPAANWLIGNVGECIPSGPCLVPVGFGLMAPSGVLMIGLALVLRDMLQEAWGRWWAIGAIVVGAGISFGLAPAELAIASGAAFLLSESADMAVYTPLRRRHLLLAVLASQAVGAIIDSAVFLWLAFGSLDFVSGQVLGKLWMGLLAASLIWLTRSQLGRVLIGRDDIGSKWDYWP